VSADQAMGAVAAQSVSLSMSPTTTAIDSSLDSIYLVFNTLLGIVRLLSQEFEHAKRQTIDLKALSKKID
ncbi:hypothetical protein AAULR_09300, partial [Lacticaseibacillus rhamnosus MTCC 5462]